MRILFVSNFYPPRAIGGAEIVAHRHAIELVKRGHDVAVFAGRVPMAGQSGGEMTLEQLDGIDVHLMSIRSLDPYRSFYWSAGGRRFRSVLHHFEPDVVHFHNLMGLGSNLILEAKSFGVKTVCTVHDHWGFCAKNTRCLDDWTVCNDFEGCHLCFPNFTEETGKGLPFRLRRDYVMNCLSDVDCLVFPSRYMRNSYIAAGFDEAATQYLSNGVDVERFDVVPAQRADAMLHIVMIGFLGEHKGIDMLIKAIENLAERWELQGRWKVSIVGDGTLRTRVQKLADDPAHRNYIHYLGKLNALEIPTLLSTTDVVLLPSIWPENEPVVMLEAMAAGVAQVASRIGGHVELVVDGESGLLFEPANVDDLVAKLTTYIENTEIAKKHGAYNRARRSAFAQELSITGYEQIYAALEGREGKDGDLVVICDGGWPSLEVAHMFNNLSLFEAERRVRFIYAGWAHASHWSNAAALFLWSAEPREDLLLLAARMNVPVLAPVTSLAVRFFEREGHGGFGYANLAEAVGALKMISSGILPSPGVERRSRYDFADYVAAAVGADAYTLHAENPAR